MSKPLNLTGSYIANIDEEGKDQGNLHFQTNGLTMHDIQDTDTFKNTNIGVGIGLSDNTPSSGSIDYSQQTHDKAQTTKATIGQGSITTGTTTGVLHRDVSTMQEITKDEHDETEFYVSDQTVALAKNPTAEIAKLETNIKNLPTKIQTQSKEIMPSSTDKNAFYAALGKMMDTLSGATGGIIPSVGSNGGLLGNLPVLLGAGDVNHKVIQVKSEGMLTPSNKDDFVPMQESEYYQSASKDEQKRLDALGDVYVSKTPVSIDADNVTYQNGTNGMLNNEGLALLNVITQTHTTGDTNINVTLNYNPTHGILGDLAESAIDKNGGTTGIAKQTGEFVYDVTSARPDANFANHSQGNILTYSGIKYINNHGGFNFGATASVTGGHKVDIPTVTGFGSPISSDDMDKLLSKSGFDFKGNYTNANDWVGEGIGGNTGYNGSSSILQRLNLYNASLLFGSSSPHSTYHCDPSKGQICGDRP